MVESEADRLPEDVMLGAVMYGHGQMQVAIDAINEFASVAGKANGIGNQSLRMKLLAKVDSTSRSSLEEAYKLQDKRACCKN